MIEEGRGGRDPNKLIYMLDIFPEIYIHDTTKNIKTFYFYKYIILEFRLRINCKNK